MEDTLRRIEDALNRHWEDLARRFPEGALPKHRVGFSRRVTTSWALIYYRRRLVQLSPYVFLLDEHELSTGNHWRELDATLRHEMAHAVLYQQGLQGHPPEFQGLLATLGVRANGACDVGPVNPTFRYVYGCPACGNAWHRRTRLVGDWSCVHCSEGRFDPRFQMHLVEELPPPWERLRARAHILEACLREAEAALRRPAQPALPRVPWGAAGEPASPASAKRGAGPKAPRARRNA